MDLLLYGGTWAAGMAVVQLVLTQAVRRRNGDQEQGRAMIRDAMATGRLPDQRNPAAWQRALTEERREAHQLRWLAGGFLLLIAGLVAAAAVVDGGWTVGLLAVALAAVAAEPFRRLTRRAERAGELLGHLADPDH